MAVISVLLQDSDWNETGEESIENKLRCKTEYIVNESEPRKKGADNIINKLQGGL